MQLYTSFDTGSVKHHFYEMASLPDYKDQLVKSKYNNQIRQSHNFFSPFSSIIYHQKR